MTTGMCRTIWRTVWRRWRGRRAASQEHGTSVVCLLVGATSEVPVAGGPAARWGREGQDQGGFHAVTAAWRLQKQALGRRYRTSSESCRVPVMHGLGHPWAMTGQRGRKARGSRAAGVGEDVAQQAPRAHRHPAVRARQ